MFKVSNYHIHGSRELAHGVEILGEVSDHVEDMIRDGRSLVELNTETLNLVRSGDLTSEQEPEETLREGLCSSCIML